MNLRWLIKENGEKVLQFATGALFQGKQTWWDVPTDEEPKKPEVVEFAFNADYEDFCNLKIVKELDYSHKKWRIVATEILEKE